MGHVVLRRAQKGYSRIVVSASYKNKTLFWNIFKNAIFQKYHTGDLRTSDAGRISPIAALKA